MTGGPTSDNWWWRDGEIDPSTAIVFDMDGVISDASTRQHLLVGADLDWDQFFEACEHDEPIEETTRLLHALDERYDIVLLTARPLRVRPHTLTWLERNGFRWDLLIMREDDDELSSRSFKRREVQHLREFGFELHLAFEDDRRNVEMFHAEGVPCVYIHSGYYDGGGLTQPMGTK